MTTCFNNMRLALMSVVLVATVAASSCTSLRIADVGRARPGDWLTEGGSGARTNVTDRDLDLPLEQRWEYNTGGGFGAGGPLVAGDFVFVHTRKGEVHAVSIDRGKKVGADSFGESVNGTPAIKDGVIFVPSAWGSKQGVVAHDLRAGAARWKYNCPPVDEGILLTGNLVIFSDAESTVHALDVQSGTLVWSVALDPRAAVTTTPVMAGGTNVVVADDRGSIFSIDVRTGRQVWTANATAPVYATPASSGSSVVIGTTRGFVLAVDAQTGAHLWKSSTGGGSTKMASPAIVGDRIVIGASDGSMRALGLTDGKPEWTWHGDNAIGSAPAIAGQQIFFGTMGKRVYALSLSTGGEVWSAEVRGRVKSTPTVHDGSVYFTSEPRYLYRFTTVDGVYAESN